MNTSDQQLYELAARLGQVLSDSSLRLATAESCTGGWIGKVVTDIPGSSTWFDRGFITYSNEAKQELLQVSATLLSDNGAVSEAVARAMAEGALAASRAHVSLAVTGVAGPDGGTAEKPVGLVWFAWGNGNRVTAEHRIFPGDREAVRRATVRHALLGVMHALKR
ncbi:MAG: CinA family protein [Ectothiorhodospiraceae bacterium]|nr:CinA family protein [Ectothiorhodospiraceae bacterium]